MQRLRRGFVLLDSLLALALLALALLLASYPLYSARDIWRDALLKKYAVHLAANTIDRIRLNASAATAYGQDYARATLWNGAIAGTCTANCSAGQQLRRDVAQIREEWQQHHSKAQMRISNCNGALCLVLWWRDGAAHRTACVEPQCLAVRFVP